MPARDSRAAKGPRQRRQRQRHRDQGRYNSMTMCDAATGRTRRRPAPIDCVPLLARPPSMRSPHGRVAPLWSDRCHRRSRRVRSAVRPDRPRSCAPPAPHRTTTVPRGREIVPSSRRSHGKARARGRTRRPLLGTNTPWSPGVSGREWSARSVLVYCAPAFRAVPGAPRAPCRDARSPPGWRNAERPAGPPATRDRRRARRSPPPYNGAQSARVRSRRSPGTAWPASRRLACGAIVGSASTKSGTPHPAPARA